MRRLGDSSVPTLPQVAIRVIELVSNSNSTINQFAEIIRTDQSLTGRLLRMVNSACFAQRRPVTTLERAMVLLGMERLKAVALGFHLSQAAMSDSGAFSSKKLWSQSLYRAWAAFRAAEWVDRNFSGEAFIVGLMGDAGVPMMHSFIGETYSQLVNPIDTPSVQFRTEFTQLEWTHTDVASALCRLWKLPELLAKPICNHHSHALPPVPGDGATVLHAAAVFAGSLILDPNTIPQSCEETFEHAAKLFGKSPEETEALMVQAGADFNASRDLFNRIIDASFNVERIIEMAHEPLGQVAEVLAEDSLEPAKTERSSRFELDGMILEMERAEPNVVRVFIADAEGHRMVTEQIDTRRHDENEIRQRLLLEGADSGIIASIMQRLTQLAA